MKTGMQVPRVVKFTETERRMIVAKGRGKRGTGFSGFHSGKMERVLETDGGSGYTTSMRLHATELFT